MNPLRLKVFDTLLVLVRNGGRLVTEQELLDTVWPETTVEDNNLNHNVFERLVALGWGRRDWVERDPDYDSLRDDPRFQRLLARMK